MLILQYQRIFILKILNGEILTLNKGINLFNGSDIKNMNKLALSLIQEEDGGADKDEK